MKKQLFTLLLITIISIGAHAQKDQTIFGKNGIRLTGIWGGANHVFGSIDDLYSDVDHNGHFGFEFNKKILIGWENLSVNYTGLDVGAVRLKTNGFGFGYSPWAYKSFHPVFSIYGGSGHIGGNYENNRMQVWQPSVDLELNVFRWMKVGLDGGYRFVNGRNLSEDLQQDLSGGYVGIKLKFGWSWGR